MNILTVSKQSVLHVLMAVHNRHCWQIETTDCVKRLAENSKNKSIEKRYEEYDDKTLCAHCAYHEEMFHPKKKNDIS